MLQEIKNTRQIDGEPFRRWFSDELFDLIVWYSTDSSIMGFQLCYREGTDEHALTWLKDSGFSHRQVDSGEDRSQRHKMTPVLLPDGSFEKHSVLRLFKDRSASIDQEVQEIVTRTINMYPNISPLSGENR